MTTLTTNPKRLETLPIPVQGKLTAAWTAFMFFYVYVDYLQLYKPGLVRDILNGVVFTFDITPTFAVVALALTAIPIAMIVLSVILPARLNRMTNLVVATLLIPYMVFNAADAGAWLPFYALGIALELALLAYIVRSAWTWPGLAGEAEAIPQTRA